MQHFGQMIQHYGVAVVFLTVFLSRAGLPFPAWPVLLVAGALTAANGTSIPLLLFAASAGDILADLLWYGAGARWGRRVLGLLCKFTLSPDSCVRQTETTFTRLGASTLLFAKFVPGFGYVAVTLCGITGVGITTFLTLDAIGSAAYVAVPLILGRIFHSAVDEIVATLVRLGEYGIALIAAALIFYVAIRWVQRQIFIRQLRMDRISVEELATLVDEGRAPVIFDVRSTETRERDGMIPGAVAAHSAEIELVLKQYSRDVEVVIYCACPNEESAAVAAQHLKRAGYKRIRPLLGGVEAWSRAGRPLAIA
ncbi:MAG TPA: DedA family protein/thiosulfate sulfurtransferase GlpE [Rhizomicrobium sp.]|jgi:membrane protein DedA with SNARE-associated domain/rhodanese-related sulfurtransferase